MRRTLAGSISTMVLLCGGWRVASTARAGAPPETRSYILRDGKATGSETFTRTATSLKGDLIIEKQRAHYEAELLPDGRVSRLEVHGVALGDPSRQVISLLIGRDSATFTDHSPTRVVTVRAATQPGVVPIINPSMAFCELVIQQARARKAQSVSVPVLSIDDLAPAKIQVAFLTPTTVMLGSLNGARDQLRLTIDAEGHVLSAVQGADAKESFSVRATTTPAPRK